MQGYLIAQLGSLRHSEPHATTGSVSNESELARSHAINTGRSGKVHLWCIVNC